MLGAPITLAIFGYWLQQIQQERANKYDRIQQKRADTEAEKRSTRDQAIAKAQRELAANQTNEDVLQVYFDRLSTLLIDKNLMAIATKVNSGGTGIYAATPEEKELVASAVNVVRARTLSILRRFEDDSKRKTSVIGFLIETDFLSKLSLDLSSADLIAAKLIGADLSHAKLIGADLSHAKLKRINLSHAELKRTNLTHAELSEANLSHAKLGYANLSDAVLIVANLSDAKLIGANLSHADLSHADVTGANLTGAKNFSPQQIKSAKNWEAATYNGKRLDDPEVIKHLGLDA